MTRTVVLADDHALMREGLKALLEAQGDLRIVAEAANGREAVRLTLALEPDVLIMDIAMPEMNGIEAAALLRRRCPRVAVVILSMHSDAEYLHRALEAGAAGYLLKEAAGREVVAAVRAVCRGGRYFSAALGDAALAAAAAPAASPLSRLSERERQVLQLVAEGRSSAEIAARLHLSPKSVDTYRSRLMKKLGLESFAALVKFALQHGVTRG